MTGARFVYFHGQPGSPEELDVVRPGAWRRSSNLFVPDRATDRPDLALGPYLDHLAEDIARRFPDGPIRLVGFSLGCFVAVEVALRLAEGAGDRDLGLDLISAAAPLDLGDFLPDMAGGMVFSLARRQPFLFALLTRIQGGLAGLAPGLLFAQVFANAAGADADLVLRPEFQATIRGVLAHSLTHGARGYRREIAGYVAQTSERVTRLTRPVTLWQGQADTWTPPAMALALAAARPATRTLRTFPGLSHYSTLQAALPEIFSALT
ncbi:MAG TPA: alpha/beta fold hydrolase [Phenylobacterium sp.]|nr:alpha/beta fold hydrolase [Phenylobacterium sp.]